MTNFILLHRRINEKTTARTGEGLKVNVKEYISPTWVNVSNINTIANTVEGDGARITMRDGFLLVEEDVNAVLDRIWRAEHGG